MKKDPRLSSGDKETNISFLSAIALEFVWYLSFNVQAFQPSLYLYLDLLCVNAWFLSCKCLCQYFNNKNNRQIMVLDLPLDLECRTWWPIWVLYFIHCFSTYSVIFFSNGAVLWFLNPACGLRNHPYIISSILGCLMTPIPTYCYQLLSFDIPPPLISSYCHIFALPPYWITITS